ncbi:MAG: FecCD family ABC transporter permease [Mycetocola sp.]
MPTAATPASVPGASVSAATAPRGPRPGQAEHTGRGRVHSGWSRSAVLVVLTAALVLLALASLIVGSRPVPVDQVWAALVGGDVADDVSHIVTQMRGPRAVLAVLVGAALGVAGALIQALTRNPLADPGILGVNAGATVAVTIGVGFFGVLGITGYLWFAFAGAIITTVVVYVLGSAGRSGATPIRLTLVGVAMGAILLGITTAITLLNPDAFDSMRSWKAGSLNGRGWDVAEAVWPAIVIGLLIAACVARPLNAVALGDDLAASLGAKIMRTRVLVILALTILAGAATAAAGPIAFVGLMIPHIARWIVGPDQRWIVAYSVVLAGALVLISDMIGRVALGPQEIPVGVVTAIVGAPALILLARRSKVSGL